MIPLTALSSRLPLSARLSAGLALLCAPPVVNWILAAEEGRRLAAVAAHGKGQAVIAALRTAGEATLYFSGVAVAGSVLLAAAMIWAAVQAEARLTRALERLSSGEGDASLPPGAYGRRAARAIEACWIALAASRATAEQCAAAAESERQLRVSAQVEAEAERRTVMAALANGLAALAAARHGVALDFDSRAPVARPLVGGPTEGSENSSAAAGLRARPAALSVRARGGRVAMAAATLVPPQPDADDDPQAAEVEDLRALLRRLGGERDAVQLGAPVAPMSAGAPGAGRRWAEPYLPPTSQALSSGRRCG